MSRTISSQLINHIAQGTTTLATCLKITLSDSTIIAFTDHDQDITYDGVIYKSSAGYIPSSVESKSNLDEESLSVNGAFEIGNLVRTDMLSGKYDYAKIEIFILNYADTTMGKVDSIQGRFGRVNFSDNQFTVNIFSNTKLFGQTIGRTYTSLCSADLGDSKCKINLSNYTETGTVLTVTDQHSFTASITDLNGNGITISDWFTSGLLTWTSGNNNGKKIEIRQHTYSGDHTLSLQEDMFFTIQSGDTFTIYAGCQKRTIEDCKNKFNNILNNRGFKYVPTRDQLNKVPKVGE